MAHSSSNALQWCFFALKVLPEDLAHLNPRPTAFSLIHSPKLRFAAADAIYTTGQPSVQSDIPAEYAHPVHKFQKTKLLKMPHTLWSNALLGTHSRTGLKLYKIANRETSKYMALNRKEGEEIDRGPSLIQSQTHITIECMKCYDFFFFSIASMQSFNVKREYPHTAHKPVTTNRILTKERWGGEGRGISQLGGGTQTARCQLDLKDTGQRTAAPRALLSAT